jgi:geranylgeranyl pyrophosphate synthase
MSEIDVPTSQTKASHGTALAVPQDAAVRANVRREAAAVAAVTCRCRSLDGERLQTLAAQLLARLGLSGEFLGFAMVSVATEYWRASFAAVPFNRRVLLLPHCLRKKAECRGVYSAEGLECASCGACAICELRREATALGYLVIISEGTPAVVRALTEGRGDAVLGVACLDSLEKCFRRMSAIGVPYVSVPLLRNGCVETVAETEVIQELLRTRRESGPAAERGYGWLLRAARGLFEAGELRRLLGDELTGGAEGELLPRTEELALDWLARAGKRFRPFITLAAYSAAGASGGAAGAAAVTAIPDAVKRVAVAMEIFHKASLAHDDVEDDDNLRYGQPTLHAVHGIPTAINAGDYLVGLGYRLVMSQKAALGADAAADIAAALADAHVKLCRGQGAELLLTGGRVGEARASDVLAIYALKTAPAFAAAMLAGMRAAGPIGADGERVAAFCRHLGVGYQILDDLDDLWAGAGGDERSLGQDFLRGRPTILRVFAAEAGAGEELERLARKAAERPRGELVKEVSAVYERAGATEKGRRLVAKCRSRATETAHEMDNRAIGQLMLFLVDMVLKNDDVDGGVSNA